MVITWKDPHSFKLVADYYSLKFVIFYLIFFLDFQWYGENGKPNVAVQQWNESQKA